MKQQMNRSIARHPRQQNPHLAKAVMVDIIYTYEIFFLEGKGPFGAQNHRIQK